MQSKGDTEMANPIAEQMIEDLTFEKISQGAMFTAFDITLFAKQEKGMTERHRNIKHVVHDMFVSGQMTGYDRSLINIPGATDRAFLYHPDGADISQYNAKDRSKFPDGGGSNNATANGMTVVTGSTSTPAATPANGQAVDRRGRLCISNKLTRSLGWHSTDLVWINFHHSGGLEISKVQGSCIGSYMIDKDDNIRVSARMLRKAGIPTSDAKMDRYTVEANATNDGIVVSRA